MNIPQRQNWETQVNNQLPQSWTQTDKVISPHWTHTERLPKGSHSINRRISSHDWTPLHRTPPLSFSLCLPFSSSSHTQSVDEANLEPDWLMQSGQTSDWPGLNPGGHPRHPIGWQWGKAGQGMCTAPVPATYWMLHNHGWSCKKLCHWRIQMEGLSLLYLCSLSLWLTDWQDFFVFDSCGWIFIFFKDNKHLSAYMLWWLNKYEDKSFLVGSLFNPLCFQYLWGNKNQPRKE